MIEFERSTELDDADRELSEALIELNTTSERFNRAILGCIAVMDALRNNQK